MHYSLFLYPTAAQGRIDPHKIQRLLESLGFVAETEPSGAFAAGDRLMEHINFLGCSPSLQSGQVDCRVRLHLFDSPVGLGGHSIDTLRYPSCKHPIDNPADLIQSGPDSAWRCTHCANQGKVSDINWRKSAAFAECFIEVSAIFPKEAVPTPAFLEALKPLCDCDWNWFYSASTET